MPIGSVLTSKRGSIATPPSWLSVEAVQLRSPNRSRDLPPVYHPPVQEYNHAGRPAAALG